MPGNHQHPVHDLFHDAGYSQSRCVTGDSGASVHRGTRAVRARPACSPRAGRYVSLCAVLVLILNQMCPLADSPACERASSASLFPEAKGRLGGQP